MTHTTVETESTWDAARRLLVTRLQGHVGVEDVRRWVDSLHAALGQIEDNSVFKLLVDLRGYDSATLDAHKQMRVVVPGVLARHGFRTALLDLFDPVDVPLTRTRGITCVAVAHVHHNADEMAEYDRRLCRANERFFTDPVLAERWIVERPSRA
jgi:hypothetical protein